MMANLSSSLSIEKETLFLRIKKTSKLDVKINKILIFYKGWVNKFV